MIKMTTMNVSKYGISLAMGKVFRFVEEMNDKQTNDWMDQIKPIMDEYQNKEHWKYQINEEFNFSDTRKAELLAAAIIWYHGTLPEITINSYYQKISVTSTGYSC